MWAARGECAMAVSELCSGCEGLELYMGCM